MNIRNLFFLGSILLLLSCKNSKQQEGYNSINIIKYINIYNENNRILTAQGTEYFFSSGRIRTMCIGSDWYGL